MTYETYRLIFIGGAIFAGLMLALSIALFFVLKIPKVIGDLTGATARKAIASINSQNAGASQRLIREQHQYRSPAAQSSHTGKIGTGRLRQKTGPTTVKFSTEKLIEEAGKSVPNETELLPQHAEETTVLYPQQVAETTVLSPSWNGPASVWPAPPEANRFDQQPETVQFVIEYEITIIHSDELIA